jgi:hypothetical protein
MKTFISIFVLILFFFGTINAQNSSAAGAGLIVALPMGSFGDAAGTGFGGVGSFEIGFTPNLVGVGQLGYISWGSEEVAGFSSSYSAVPLLLGVKYFFTPGSGFYGTTSLGLHFFSFSADVPGISIGGQTIGGGSASATSTDFTFLIGAGYEFPLNQQFSLDFSGAYNLISDANYVTVRAGGKMRL